MSIISKNENNNIFLGCRKSFFICLNVNEGMGRGRGGGGGGEAKNENPYKWYYSD